ncbi:MAG: type I restriction enzyme endonuclease domain-containing protein [Bacteroides sp.]
MAKKKKEETLNLENMLRKAIREYKNTNKIAAEKYEALLKETLDKYHERRSALSVEEASQTQATAVSKIMEEATKQTLELLEQLGKDRESFRHLGLTFEEKAFYDILMHLRDKYNFEYGEDNEENGFIFNDKCKILILIF